MKPSTAICTPCQPFADARSSAKRSAPEPDAGSSLISRAIVPCRPGRRSSTRPGERSQHDRYPRRLRMEQRGKRRTIIAVAAARELAGFCWAISTA